MGPAHLAGHADAQENRKSPAQRDVRIAAHHDLARRPRAEQDHHGHDADAEDDQHKSAQKLGQQFAA